MQPPKENPATLAACGAPETVEAGASNSSDSTVIRFRKQALRTTDAVIGQLIAIGDWVRTYQLPVGELRAILVATIDLGETIGGDLDTIAADQSITLAEPVDSDWKPEPGAGLLGALSSLAQKDGGDA